MGMGGGEKGGLLAWWRVWAWCGCGRAARCGLMWAATRCGLMAVMACLSTGGTHALQAYRENTSEWVPGGHGPPRGAPRGSRGAGRGGRGMGVSWVVDVGVDGGL